MTSLLGIDDVHIWQGDTANLVDLAAGALTALRHRGDTAGLQTLRRIGADSIGLQPASHGASLSAAGYFGLAIEDAAAIDSSTARVAVVCSATRRAMWTLAQIADPIGGLASQAAANRVQTTAVDWRIAGTWHYGDAVPVTEDGAVTVPAGGVYMAITTSTAAAGTVTAGTDNSLPKPSIAPLPNRPTAVSGGWTGWLLSGASAASLVLAADHAAEAAAALEELEMLAVAEELESAAVGATPALVSGAAAQISLTGHVSDSFDDDNRSGLGWAYPRTWNTQPRAGGQITAILIGWGAGGCRFDTLRTTAAEQAAWGKHLATVGVRIRPAGSGSGLPQIKHAGILALEQIWQPDGSQIRWNIRRTGPLDLTAQ